jgi:hypothetical protein
MNHLEITRRRLRNQGLSKIIFKDANDIVAQLGAVQAQDYAGAKWALGQRLKDSSDTALDQAFADGSILRTHLLRPTWHFVSPINIRWLLKLTAPRVHAASAYMYRQSGLEKAIFNKSNAAIEKALRDGKQLTRAELASALSKAGIPADGFRLGYLMMYAELEGVICSGARRGKQFTYVLLEERVPPVKAISRDDALAELAKRYFTTRGPATAHDFAWWSGLTVSDAKKGIEANQAQLAKEAMNRQTYWFDESRSSVKIKSPLVHLLPNYDEYFIGFKDRSAIGDIAKQTGIKGDNPALIAHIIILDGQIVGGWRRTLEKNKVSVEATLITTLSKEEDGAVTDAAERFGRFLELPVSIRYKKYSNKQSKARSL